LYVTLLLRKLLKLLLKNGKMLGAKPLYVALAQRKDIRKAQLEAQHAQRAKAGIPPMQGAGRVPGAPLQPIYPAGPMFYPNVVGQAPMVGNNQPQIMYPPPPGQMMRRGGMYPGPQNYQGLPPHYVVAAGSAPVQRGGVQTGVPRPRPLQSGGGGGSGASGGMKSGGPNNSSNGGRGARTSGGQGRGRPNDMHMNQGINMINAVPIPEQQPIVAPAIVHPVADQAPALTSQSISSFPQEQQRMILGERLYPLVHVQQPELAGKITGMLLDSFDVPETIQLIENHDALNAKILEAVDVLKAHQAQNPTSA